jgi:excisionase family DNA binding protein
VSGSQAATAAKLLRATTSQPPLSAAPAGLTDTQRGSVPRRLQAYRSTTEDARRPTLPDRLCGRLLHAQHSGRIIKRMLYLKRCAARNSCTPILETKPQTMSVEEAGRRLGIGRMAAYQAVWRGQIPSIRIGRRLLVPVAKLNEMLGETA